MIGLWCVVRCSSSARVVWACREGETLNAKGDRIAAFAIARTLVLGLEEGSAEERLGLGPHPFWQLEVG